MIAENRSQSPPENSARASRLEVHLRKTFASRRAPAFSVEAEFTAPPGVTIIFGPSGAGKSTILNCIAGLLEPEWGRIAIAGRILFDSENHITIPPERRSVALVFADLALFPHLRVEENIAYGIRQLSSAERKRRVADVLESFRITRLGSRRPSELSSGESQRVALARSLVTDPQVLLLDEPLSSLDAGVKSGIIDDLRAWNRARSIPILYITHNLEEAFALGEQVIVIEGGRILAKGRPLDVLRMPRHETIAQLAGFENIFDATVESLREPEGTMTCRLAGTEVDLEVPLARVSEGGKVRVGLRAGDILLAARRPELLSARNILPGRIESLTQVGTRVEAQVRCGKEFVVHLTPGAVHGLSLQAGSEVWLVIKSYSCHLLV
jgi:molybdate transport system ATP-binding protein